MRERSVTIFCSLPDVPRPSPASRKMSPGFRVAIASSSAALLSTDTTAIDMRFALATRFSV